MDAAGFFAGSIVIGNDYSFGGIVGTEMDQIILPIPFGIVTKIPKSQLSKYFPKGYKIKMNTNVADYFFDGLINGNFATYFSCSNCNGTMVTFRESQLFPINEILEFAFVNDSAHMVIGIGGYVYKYNTSSNTGSIALPGIAIVHTDTKYQSWYFTSSSQMDFSFNPQASVFNFNGSLMYREYVNLTSFMDFNGSLPVLQSNQY